MKYILKNYVICVVFVLLMFGFISMLGINKELENGYLLASCFLGIVNAMLLDHIYLFNNHEKNYRRFDHRIPKKWLGVIIACLFVVSIAMSLILKAYYTIIFVVAMLIFAFFSKYFVYLLALAIACLGYTMIFNIGKFNLDNNLLILAITCIGVYMCYRLKHEVSKIAVDDRY